MFCVKSLLGVWPVENFATAVNQDIVISLHLHVVQCGLIQWAENIFIRSRLSPQRQERDLS